MKEVINGIFDLFAMLAITGAITFGASKSFDWFCISAGKSIFSSFTRKPLSRVWYKALSRTLFSSHSSRRLGGCFSISQGASRWGFGSGHTDCRPEERLCTCSDGAGKRIRTPQNGTEP